MERKNKLKLKLDRIDMRILATLDRDCRTPSSAIARMVRRSRQSVDYRIRRLVDEGLITSFNASINPLKMGYRIYKLYLQLRNAPSERKRLFEYLRRSPRVYWMGECDGAWDAIFAIFAKSDYEFYALKNGLISDFGGTIVKHAGDVLLDARQYPKAYFGVEPGTYALFGGELNEVKMDELDHAIVASLVNDARVPITSLAVAVGSTPATVASRLRRLEDSGVIIQYRIGVDLAKAGLELYKTIIHLERCTEDDGEALAAYVSGLPSANYFIRNLWDIELEFAVNDYQEYRAVVDGLRMRFPDIIRNVESVLMKSDEWTPGFKKLVGKIKE